MSNNEEAQKRRAVRLRDQIDKMVHPQAEDPVPAPPSNVRDAIEKRMHELDQQGNPQSEAIAHQVYVDEQALTVYLQDGRTVTVPLTQYPWLLQATPEELHQWHLIEDGKGIRWPDLGQEISTNELL